MKAQEKINAYILAGGESRRFEGQAKGMQLLNGTPLITHLINKLTPQADTVFINSHIDDYQALGLKLVDDLGDNYHGPLAGLYASMLHAKSIDAMWFIITPCDSPFIPDDLVSKLLAPLLNSQAALASYINYQGHMQPPFSVWNTRLLPKLEAAIKQEGWGGLKIFIKSLGDAAIAVEYKEQKQNPFFNINCRQDLLEAEKLL